MMDGELDEVSTVEGVKSACIRLSMGYPIVSAYEFEFLKDEAIVQRLLRKCTIYLIVQRPMVYFNNVVLSDGEITFDITDGDNRLPCAVSLVAAAICTPGEVVDVSMEFLSRTPGTAPPFHDVGAIKVYRKDGSFAHWWSPFKFLHEVLVNGLPARLDGDPMAFADFRVHYIGKAFSQKVWDRLTGHKKMQRILTLEGPVGASREASAPFEIALIMLEVVGLDDVPEIPHIGATDRPGISPIKHAIDLDDEAAVGRFMFEPLIGLGDEAMTRESEALLIRTFRPTHNETMFDIYPNIKGGMRQAGYSYTDLIIEQMPVRLHTDHHEVAPVLDGPYAMRDDESPLDEEEA